jgi:hypothetical protein
MLARELKVSLRLVDLMLADAEITPNAVAGKVGAVLFVGCVAGVREKAKTSKRSVTRRVKKRGTGL